VTVHAVMLRCGAIAVWTNGTRLESVRIALPNDEERIAKITGQDSQLLNLLTMIFYGALKELMPSTPSIRMGRA
jgi:hypothetical protein